MKLNLAGIQMSTVIGNKKENIEKAVTKAEEAIEKGANFICLPETFNTGFFPHTKHWDTEYFHLAETIEGETITTFQKLAKDHKVNIVVPFFEKFMPGVFYNSAAVVNSAGEILGLYRKVHVPWSFTSWEKFYMRPGNHFPVFNTEFGKVGVLICYDRDFPEAAKSLALQGASIIFVPNGASLSLKETWRKILSIRAYENQLFVMGTSLTGKCDEEHHDLVGHSLIANPLGEVIDELEREEDVLVSEVDLQEIDRSRLYRYIYRDRRPEVYSKVVEY